MFIRVRNAKPGGWFAGPEPAADAEPVGAECLLEDMDAVADGGGDGGGGTGGGGGGGT